MKTLKLLCNRVVIFGLLLSMQAAWLFLMIFELGKYSGRISAFLSLLSILVALFIVYKDENPAYKLAWIVPILVFPIFGGLLYLAMGNKKPSKKYRIGTEQLTKELGLKNSQNEEIMAKIKFEDPIYYGQVHYLSRECGYPVYRSESSKYYELGELYYKDLLEDIKAAKHFIFMEYFIVEEGKMFTPILEVLEQKAKEGLDVRFIYDDFGSASILPLGYHNKLEQLGIKCFAFNKFVPFISVAMNNRDHRKITVIDGHTAYTGGINLADEYINEKMRFGHWKDTGIRIQGDAVWNFTVMFLQMWNINRKTDEEFSQFKPKNYKHEMKIPMDQRDVGYVQPYGDTPMDNEITGEDVYLNIINTAREYVYIFTPYLIIDHEMVTAITLAAKRGVDVRIVTPGIPDKKIVNAVTKSYYSLLIKAGVRIFEYTPGFIHAKV
ncbi:MAG: phospholipase D-like domain-containing protein, partial [bacterium]|nr:phospholipase D-like domain-containing protein [bacterium]